MDEKQHIKNIISKEICSRCGGEVDGWKCEKCRYTSDKYMPLHWRDCKYGGKMRLKCKKCSEAENNCSCN